MTAPKEIEALMEHFSRSRDAYHSGKYNETQLRREFIDPFFKALGWDMDNTAGHAEAYKDVITLNPEIGEALAEVKKTNVSNLPIHIINFFDSSEKARHDRMVELVGQMLSLHQKLAKAKADHEETSLKRRIDATDSQIDRLVYDLYQLTEEEIGIVENEQ